MTERLQEASSLGEAQSQPLQVTQTIERVAREIGGRTYALVAGFAIFVWVQAITNLSLTADDLARILPPRSERANGLRLGRWVHYYVNQIAFDIPYAHAFTGTFIVLGFATLAMVVAYKAGLHRKPVLAVVFGGLVVANPIIAEAIVFKLHHLPLGIGIFMAALTGLLLPHLDATERTPLWHLVVAGAALVITTASYQGIVPMMVTGLLGAQMVRYVRSNDADRSPLRLRPMAEIVATFIVSGIVYFISFKLTLAWGSDRESGSTRYNPEETRIKWTFIKREMSRLWDFWTDATFTYPQWTKLVFLALAIAAVGAGVARVVSSVGTARQRLLGPAFLVLGMLTVHILPFIILFVREEPVTRYNVIMGVCMVPAVVFALFYVGVIETAPTRFRRVSTQWLVAVIALVVFTFGLSISRSLTALELGQQRTQALATRVLDRIEQNPGYLKFTADTRSREVPIAFIGNFTRPDERFPMPEKQDGWFTVTSCLGPPCQIERLADNLSLISLDGSRFMWTNRGQAKIDDIIDEKAPNMPHWPAPGSVKFIAGTVVVKGPRS